MHYSKQQIVDMKNNGTTLDQALALVTGTYNFRMQEVLRMEERLNDRNREDYEGSVDLSEEYAYLERQCDASVCLVMDIYDPAGKEVRREGRQLANYLQGLYDEPMGIQG